MSEGAKMQTLSVRVRQADLDEIRSACRGAALATLATLGIAGDQARLADSVSTFVAGYATAMLHVRALAVEPVAVLEHARAALAEVG